jgi:hypothetical protein
VSLTVPPLLPSAVTSLLIVLARALPSHCPLETVIQSGVELCVRFSAGHIMRTLIALVSALLPSASFADSVRHLSVPERFWGTWAPSADLCADDKSVFVVSAKGYVSSQASCTIQWVTETVGASGPFYSAHMRCSNPATPNETTEVNRIIVANEGGELSAGPDFKQLKSYRRCPAN